MRRRKVGTISHQQHARLRENVFVEKLALAKERPERSERNDEMRVRTEEDSADDELNELNKT